MFSHSVNQGVDIMQGPHFHPVNMDKTLKQETQMLGK
jgi:hypothetical protein